MRIAVLQTEGDRAVVEPNLERLELKSSEAAKAGARLLVCPELYLTGYNVDSPAMARLAEAAGGASAKRVADIAKTNGIAILYGYAERDGETVYNSTQLIDSKGNALANYRKSHLFGELENRSFKPGETLVRTELEGVPVGLLICYDVEFPEPMRAYALAGAAMVLVPTALTKPHDFVAHTLVPARGWENQLFVVYADRCGSEGKMEYCGLSTIAGPDGKIIAQAGESEALLIADLDLEARERARRSFDYLGDRRPEVYQSLLNN